MHMKKIKRSIIVVLIVLALFLPIPTGLYDDGGTREYSALTYTIVDWNKMIYNDANDSIEIYENTSVYWFPDNFKSIDELWEIEKEKNVKIETDTQRMSESDSDTESKELLEEEGISDKNAQAIGENELLKAWTGDFTEEKLKAAIEEYQTNYTTVSLSAPSRTACVSFETDFDVASCGVIRLSPTDENDISVELDGYIDLTLETKREGNKVTIATGWWYRDDSWANDYPVWSYLVLLKDINGVTYYYYFRIDYSVR